MLIMLRISFQIRLFAIRASIVNYLMKMFTIPLMENLFITINLMTKIDNIC